MMIADPISPGSTRYLNTSRVSREPAVGAPPRDAERQPHRLFLALLIGGIPDRHPAVRAALTYSQRLRI
jgi:hypothetical protein